MGERAAADAAAPSPRVPLDRVCVVMLAAVGDAIHALPVINAIVRAHPRSRITWVMQPGLVGLLDGHPAIHEIIPFQRASGWRGFAAVRRELRRRAFDVVLVLQPYLKSGIVASFAPAPVRLGFDRARARDLSWLFTNTRLPARPLQHMQDQYLEFLDWLGVPRGALEWRIGPWSDAERAWQRDFLTRLERPIAPIVVATSKPQKDWLPERWAEVCDALHHDFALQPVLVGGNSSRERAAERTILERARSTPVSALGNGGLRGLAAIIDGAALVLSPDTGPLHLSVALDTPVISLLGYANPRRVGPYRKFGDLTIDAYGEPGEEYPVTMETRRDRMPRITVRQVLEKVERWRTAYGLLSR
ncbi:MAG: glycosyltransferase family 9 protein [Gemmatimonadaceae bacterium]